MAGYSGTRLTSKLGIKEGTTVALIAAPVDFGSTLGELPSGAVIVDSGDPAEVVLLFALTFEELESRFTQATKLIPQNGGIWIAWPKKSAGLETELDFAVVQSHGLEAGLVDNKVCAIDETWSGLRFVIRREDRVDWSGR